MKFGDKLISLRKKHGLSQEELAAKLNVSRQSVSKWESNNTYPETDKIVQICNIFDCRMDDLINDKVSDVTQCERKNKNNFTVIFDSLLEFITKSINMFSNMKFTSGLKCVIELFVLAVCLFAGVMIISELGSAIIMKLFIFMRNSYYWEMREIVSAILQIIGVCFSAIVLVHTFKIRYLDYYDQVILEEKNKEKKNESTKDENKDKKSTWRNFKFNLKKEPKVVIRDEKHTTFAFLTVISKVIIWMVKFFVAMFALSFVATLVCLVCCFVLSVYLSGYSVMFIGADIGILAAIIINIIVLLLMIYFIINKKTNLKVMCYVFLGSLVLMGIGAGIGFIGFTEFKVIDGTDYQGKTIQKTKYVNVEENMVIYTDTDDGYTMTIDDKMSDKTIKVVGTQAKDFYKEINTYNGDYYGMNYMHVSNYSYLEFDTFMKLLMKDLKNKTLRSYYAPDAGKIEIVCNEKVAKMLIDNAEKIHLVDYEKTDSGYSVKDYRQKIESDSNCNLKYNAVTGKYTYDENCVCEKKVIETPLGEKIDFDCFYKTYE